LDESARLRLDVAGGPMGTPTVARRTVRVRVFAEQVEHLRGYGFLLTWDPSVLRFAEAAEGPGHLLESQGGETGLFQVLDRRPGQVVVANGLVAGEPVSGDGLLAELRFGLREEALASVGFEVPQAFVYDGHQVRRVAAAQAQLRPLRFALGAAYPNPFNPSTHIDVALPVDTAVHLDVFDVLGRRVRRLMHDAAKPSGFYSVTWDGRDGQDRAVGSGLYFYRLETPAFTKTGRMMLLK
jgi:hypothetical protein